MQMLKYFAPGFANKKFHFGSAKCFVSSLSDMKHAFLEVASSLTNGSQPKEKERNKKGFNGCEITPDK